MLKNESFICRYERATAGHIEQQLTDSKVKLWADAFASDNSVKTRNQIFFGHQRTERYDHISFDNRLVYRKRYFLEIRVELFTLKNHQECLNLIETVLDEVLPNYQPFWEFTPFVPEESGDVSRNNDNNSWIYRGSGYTEISSDVVSLTPISKPITGRIIKVGLYNAESENNSEIGTFSR
jgi:hypothetical protein